MLRALLIVLLYTILAGAWAWRLRQEPEIVLDPHRDQKLERLTRYLSKSPPEIVQRILMSVAFIKDEKLSLVNDWLDLPTMEQLRDLTVRDNPMLHDTGTLGDALLLAWLGQENTPIAPNAAHLMIAAAGTRLDNIMRLYAFETLATRARQEGDAATTMAILDRAILLPNAPWHLTRTYTQIARERDLPAAALAALTDWIKKHPHKAKPAELEEARELQNHFLLLLGRHSEALDLQLGQLQALPQEAPIPEAILNRALISARAAGQLIQTLPWLERQLSQQPEHKLTPEALLKKTTLSTAYLHWLREHAALADRELPPARAFEASLRLAAAGERSALARLCALAETAKRTPEATRFLHLALRHPSLQPALLTLAQQAPLARRIVTEALRQSPDDRALHYAATAADAAAAPGSAAHHWQTYLRHFPQDTQARRHLIQAHLSARQPALALRVLESLSPETLTEEDKAQRSLLQQL